MKTEYLPSFIKDLKKLKKIPIYPEIKSLVFQKIPNESSITEIRNLKKIKGHKDAYRIRLGDYRIGIFIKEDTITFSRVLHRKEVYRYFP
ncbi:MAG: type II toxin-antitoxin system RelE/ParE family toxin [Xenococcus sp. MO_188.B8]|nr:type II toxin-antitoxin system RelE/ParE family toxin [Xenococcus sp. MO_188.B8]